MKRQFEYQIEPIDLKVGSFMITAKKSQFNKYKPPAFGGFEESKSSGRSSEMETYTVEVDPNNPIGFKGLPKDLEEQLKTLKFDKNQIQENPEAVL